MAIYLLEVYTLILLTNVIKTNILGLLLYTEPKITPFYVLITLYSSSGIILSCLKAIYYVPIFLGTGCLRYFSLAIYDD